MINTQKAQQQINFIEENIKELARQTEDFKKSEFFKNYLNIISKFYNYSYFNQLLIFYQYPQAERVAGFKRWNDLNRKIIKGSKSISILIPLYACFDKNNHKVYFDKTEKKFYCKKCLKHFNKTELNKYLYGFRSGFVFDIKQTEGEPLPTINIDIEGDNFKNLLEILKSFCSDHNIEIEFKNFGVNSLYGYSLGGKVAIAEQKTINTQVATLIHEITHELLKHIGQKDLNKTIKETQAESVAYVVCRHFKLETKSYNYLALYNSDYKIIMNNLKEVSLISNKIINYIEKNFKDGGINE